MKIILKGEVSGLGAAGDVVEVKDGYARNYLIPNGLAIRWTRGGEKDVAQIRRGRKLREIASVEQANAVKSELEGVQVRLSTRAGCQRPASSAPSPRPTSPRRSSRPAARTSTSGASSCPRRSRASAPTRCPYGCTPRSTRRSASRSW